MATRDDSDIAAIAAAGEPARRSRSHAARLSRMARLRVQESDAEQLWRNVAGHRRELLRRLGRDVGQRVALLDYLLNVHPRRVDAATAETPARDAIQRRTVSDPLTALYDGGYFDLALERELERGNRERAPLSLLLLDVDRFKAVNAASGHKAGDQVLEAFGGLIMKHLRGADVPCRLGGDQFAIILSDTAQAEAGVVADRFRADVECWFQTHPVGGRLFAVTVSGGIATAPFHAVESEELCLVADGALCEAKRGGGNRIVTAGAPGAPDDPFAA